MRPDLKKGQITPQEESIILELHARWGNRWSTIARSLPGRTDNEIKNYWRTHFKKKAKNSPDSAEKAKNRLIRRQQFQQQQQQQQMQQQQQLQQLQFNLDIKGIMALLEEHDHRVAMPSLSQMRQEMYQNTIEEQGWFYSMINGNAPAPEPSNDDTFWDGLWNMDDLHGNFSAANKANLHSLVAPFC